MSLGPVTTPIWMFYRTGLIILYALVHVALCVLHCQMGALDRSTGEATKLSSSFGKIKTGILAGAVLIVSMVAFVLLLLEMEGVDNYESEDDAKFARRHSVA